MRIQLKAKSTIWCNHPGTTFLWKISIAAYSLAEIISEPEFPDGQSYLEKLKTVLLYIGVSDCKMDEGPPRYDVNISMREKALIALARSPK